MSEVDKFLDSYEAPKTSGQKPAAPAAKPASEVDSLMETAPPQDKGFLGHARDLGLAAVKSAIAVPETLVGLADIPTGGRVGKFLENEDGAVGFRPKQAKEFVSEFHTDQYKDQQSQFQEADGILDKTAVAIQNPSLIANTVVESAAPMLAGGVAARGLMAGTRLGQAGARAAERGASAAQQAQAAGRAAAAAGAIGEGAMMAGAQAEAIRQETDDGLLTPTQAGAAVATGLAGTLFGYLGGRVAQRFGLGDVDTMLARGANPQQVASEIAALPAKSIPRQVVEGAISEGFLEELPQSISEQIIQNLALGKQWSEGVEDAAVMGTLAGMAMGGGASLYSGMTRPEPQDGGLPPPAAGNEPPAAPPQGFAPTSERPVIDESALGRAGIFPPAPAPIINERALEPTAPTPSQQMGLDPAAGPMSAAAALAVDTGASATMQQAAQSVDPETGEILETGARVPEQKQPTDTPEQMRERLGFIEQQARVNGGWDRRTIEERDRLQAELAKAEPAADQVRGATERVEPAPAIDVSGRTDEQLRVLEKAGRDGWREAAVAEIQRRAAQQMGNATGDTLGDASTPDAKAKGAAKQVLAQGGSEADAGRAATDSLIEDMAKNPGISIAEQAPAAVKAAKAEIEKPAAAPQAAAAPAADIKAVLAKQIPDMTDGELQQAIAHYGPSNKRTAKLQKELQKRGQGAQTTAAIAPGDSVQIADGLGSDVDGQPGRVVSVRGDTASVEVAGERYDDVPVSELKKQVSAAASEGWDGMTAEQRAAVLTKPGGWSTAKGKLNVIGKQIAGRNWSAINPTTRATIERLMQGAPDVQPAQVDAASGQGSGAIPAGSAGVAPGRPVDVGRVDRPAGAPAPGSGARVPVGTAGAQQPASVEGATDTAAPVAQPTASQGVQPTNVPPTEQMAPQAQEARGQEGEAASSGRTAVTAPAGETEPAPFFVLAPGVGTDNRVEMPVWSEREAQQKVREYIKRTGMTADQFGAGVQLFDAKTGQPTARINFDGEVVPTETMEQARARSEQVVARQDSAAAQPATPEFTTLKDRDGKTVTVRTADLSSTRERMPTFTKEGKRRTAWIHRDNLDPTGEKQAEGAKEMAGNPLFNVITTKDGGAFAIKAAASREINARGLAETHEVVPAGDVQAGMKGYLVRKKAEAPAVVATHKDPGQPAEPVTQPVIAEAVQTSARNTDFNPAEAKAWILSEIDKAIAVAPTADRIFDGVKIADKPATYAGVKTWSVDGPKDADGLTPSLNIEQAAGGGFAVVWGKSPDQAVRAPNLELAKEDAARIVKTGKFVVKGKTGNWQFDATVLDAKDFVSFDVPGDGKFKVVNTVEKLRDFRAKVEKSPGFAKNPDRPMNYGSGMAGAVNLDAEIRRIEGLSAADRRYQGGDVLEEIGNAIEIARLKKSKDEGNLLDRFKEASKGKDYDTWRAEQETAEETAAREAAARQRAGQGDPQAFAQMMAMYDQPAESAQATSPVPIGADSLVDAIDGEPFVPTQGQKDAVARFESSKQGTVAGLFLMDGDLYLIAERNGEQKVARLPKEGKFIPAPDGLLGFGFRDRRRSLIQKSEYDAKREADERRAEEGRKAAEEAAKPKVYEMVGGSNAGLRYVKQGGNWHRVIDGKLHKLGRRRGDDSLLNVLDSQDRLGQLIFVGNFGEQPDPAFDAAEERAMEAELDRVPGNVQSRLSIALAALRETRDRLAGVMRARGKGQILAVEVRDAQDEIARRRAVLDEFRAKAGDNDIDADLVIRALGGEPEFTEFGEPAAVEAPAQPPHYADLRDRARAYWAETVVPAVREYLGAFSAFGAGRLERNRAKPEGMSAREWLESFQRKESEWRDGRKVSETGVQTLSRKDLWPTEDGSGERLRKSMLAAIKALRGAPMTTSDMLAEAFMESSAAPAANQPALTGPRRNPAQVSAFAPYAAGDIVTIDGQDWQVQQDMGGWYLTSTGNWRGMHPTIQKIRGMNELIAEIERAATAQPAAAADQGGATTEAAATAADLLTPDQARTLMTWEDLGQRDNVKSMRLAFFESAESMAAKRGAMNYGTIESYQGGKWNIDGTTYPTLKAAKAAAEDAALVRLANDGYVAQPFAAYDAVARTYGYEVRADGAIGSEGKFPGPTIKEKGGRLRVESSKGDLLGSYPAAPESLGRFLESFWGAEKQVAQPGAEQPASDRDQFTVERVDEDRRQTLTFVRGETVKVSGKYPMETGEIDGISNARKEFRIGGAWLPFGYAYKAEYDEFAAPRRELEEMIANAERRIADGNGFQRDGYPIRDAREHAKRYSLEGYDDTLNDLAKRGQATFDRSIAEDRARMAAAEQTDRERREAADAADAAKYAGPVKMTMDEWKRIGRDFKSFNGGNRTVMQDGRIRRVEIVKEKAEAPDAEASAGYAAQHEALMASVRTGKATPEAFKASFEQVVANEAAIKAELSAKTKAELLREGGPYLEMRYANEKKDGVVDAVYRQMIGEYALGESVTYGMARDSYQKAVRRMVEATDADKLAQYVRDREAAIQEAEVRRTARAEAMANPQTLNDYRSLMNEHIREGKTRHEAFLMLTPEQRIRYDELEAEGTREAREARKRAAQNEVRAAGQTTGGQIIATKHTRDGHDLFVVQLADRLSREDYSTVLAGAKRLGGRYSAFRGNGAVPGFQFRTREDAEAFLKLAGGDVAAAKDQVEQRRDAFADDKSQTAAERLAEMADRMEQDANAEESRDRKANTARRARFASAALNAAAAQKAMARTMRNIAQAIQEGRAKFLDAVRTRTQVEALLGYVRTAKDNELRAKYPSYADQEKRKGEPATAETAGFAEFPSYTAFRSDLAMLGRQMLEIDGTKKLGQKLMSVADDVTDAYLEFARGNIRAVSQFGRGDALAEFASRDDAERAIRRSGLVGKAVVLPIKRGQNRIILSPSEAMNRKVWAGDGDKRITLSGEFGKEMVEAIGRRGDKTNGLAVPWQFQNAYDRRKLLSRIGIETPSEFRSALREVIALQETAVANKVREMELAMVGRRADGLDFFPTPAEIADQMVEAADIKPDMAVLEPSAGMGHIADRIREAGAEPDVIEISADRRELLEEKGYHIAEVNDFMSMEPRKFFTYGDIFRAPDGKQGILRGLGSMGSQRVRLEDEQGNRLGMYQRDEVVGVAHRGSWSGYDRIIMNPPFSDRRDAEHVQHAYTLLRPGGRIVAIMGEGVFFGQDKRAQDFRDWLDSVGGTSEKLPEGSFMDPSLPVQTGVNARMAVIDRPAVDGGIRQQGDADPEVAFSATLPRDRNAVRIGITEKGLVRAMRLQFDGLADVTSKLLARGRAGKRGGVIVVGTADNAEIARIVAERTGRKLDSTMRKFSSAGRLNGFYDPKTGLTFLVGPNLNPVTATAVMLHEMMHGQQRQKIDARALEMVRNRHNLKDEDLRSFLDRVMLRMIGAGEVGNAAEASAYIVEQAVIEGRSAGYAFADNAFMQWVDTKISKRVGDFLRSFAGMIRTWMLRNGLGAKTMTVDDFVGYAMAGLDRAASGEVRAGAMKASASIGARAPQSEAFRRWFGDSKVVDASGQPLVVYHGTDANITEFKVSERGTYGGGIYLTPDTKGASDYAIYRGQQSPTVYPLYASIKNPATGAEAARIASWRGEENARAELIARGYDGVIDMRSGEIVAFYPEQIKSATGNNGDFDPDNDDIRFSRSGMRELASRATTELNQTLSAPGKLSWWHKTIGTMYNLAERSPAFRPVFQAAQGFIDDVSHYAADAAERAPKLLPRLETWRDIMKSPISAEDNKAVGKPIFEGTLSWTRDADGRPVRVDALIEAAAGLSIEEMADELVSRGAIEERTLRMWRGMPDAQFESAIRTRYENSFLQPGIVWTDDELARMFSLTPAQIELYREFRAAVDRSLDTMARADMLRFAGEDVRFLRDPVMEAETLREAASLIVMNLSEQANAQPDRAEQLMATGQGVMDRMQKVLKLQAQGYAPLSRFGKYTVDVVVDGNREYFGLFETAREANKMAERMRAEFGAGTVTQGTLSDEAFRLFAGITPESLELFGNMLGLDSTGDEAQDRAFQEYLRLTKTNRSALRRLIHRKGIAGFSEDVGRVLASFAYSNARQTAAGLHMGDLSQAVSDIPKEQGELKDVAVKLAEYIKNPQEEAQAIRGLLFAQYLGGSVASAFVNMTQPAAVTFPWLSQHGGAKVAAAEIGKAAKHIATRGHRYEPDLAEALKAAEEDGVVSPQEVHQLMAQARGSGSLTAGDGTRAGNTRALASNSITRLSAAWGKLFSAAEQLNRRITFIAAYRVAKQKRMEDPAAFARRAVQETQFVYSKASKMQWGRGAVGGTLMTFKTYSVAYMELMSRLWSQGAPGSAERKAGRKAVALMLAMVLLMGGGGGLPFMEDAEDLIDGIAQIAGYNFSTKKARQQFLIDTFGADAADFIERGVSGLPGVPLDVSGRLGLGNLIPGTGLFLDRSNHTRDVLELLGPVGDLGNRIVTGARKALSGDLGGAALEVSPVAVRNVAKGVDMAVMDQYRDTRGRKVLETTDLEAALKAIGFQPASVAKVQDANYLNQRAKDFYSLSADRISAAWAAGIYEKDSGKVQEARDMIAQWNEDNPDQPMMIRMPNILRRVREMGKDKAQRIADTAPRAMRQQLREELLRQ